MNKLDKYIDNEGYSPISCPNCGNRVTITNSRDCNVLSTYASCEDELECQGTYFSIESEAFAGSSDELKQSDFEIVAIKYYNWASRGDKIDGYRCNGEWD